ncbi:RPGF5 factor, partial [Polypterus senegalus]
MDEAGESADICAPEVGHLGTWRWSKNTREQVQLKQRLKDLPALLKHGLTLRKRSVEAVGCNAGLTSLKSDQTFVFEDTNAFYQFSYDECEMQDCEFRNEKEWQNGVRLLMQMVPYVQFRIGVINQPEEETGSKKELCSEILQMKALERLTSTAGVVCSLHEREDISRIEIVQKLAKGSCRLLQSHSSKIPEKASETDTMFGVGPVLATIIISSLEADFDNHYRDG